ncbi:hypothetical protein Dsin_003259 [Dipteronia sinensis]|uniref:Uncharacterized protein n=1 Tax=Dipteronia sinensis TaxID=43782 RepID=A0AAE0B8M1_9ROSI|nr:hypothetical protein Dsin_003259 [Dipteronia sinensis]
MSSEVTISNPVFTWTPNGSGGEVERGVEADSMDVERQVSVADPSNIVNVNRLALMEFRAVRAVARLVGFSEYVDVEESSCSGRMLGILAEENSGSVLTDGDMGRLRTSYRILDSFELCAVKEHERADYDIPGWTCFYEYNLRHGFRFPVPSLARRLLVYYDLAPRQLMPNSLRIILILITLPAFVDLVNEEIKPHCLDPVRRTNSVLNIPVEERSWKVLMHEGNLKSSIIWLHSTWNVPRTPYPLVKDIVTYTWVRRSLEILCGTRFLTPITDVERRFADESMSKAKFSLHDLAEALKLQKEAMSK